MMTPCLFNNEWTDLESLNISVQSDAVQYGAGLFETMRTYGNKSLPFLEAHLTRLNHAIESLGFPCKYSINDFRSMVEAVACRHDSSLQRLKILVIPEGVIVSSYDLVEVKSDSTLTTWQSGRGMPEYKSTSYMTCHLAWQYAQKNGFDDSILLDDSGQVYETSRANLFWVKGGQVYTRENDVLPGIMRQFVLSLEHPTVAYHEISFDELQDVDEVFITNSIHGIVAIKQICSSHFELGTITKKIQDQLSRYVDYAIYNN